MESKENTPTTIDEYISGFPQEIQERMQLIRKTILAEVPNIKELISWKMASFKLKKYILQFAGYKNHIGLYPGPKAIENFKDDLTTFKTTKGGIQLPNNKPIPVEIIIKIIKYNVKEENKF